MPGTQKLSVLKKYRFRVVLFVAIFWTTVDMIVVLLFNSHPADRPAGNMILRECIVFLMSAIMGYLLVFVLRRMFRNHYLWISLLLKSITLIAAAFLMNTLLYTISSIQSSVPLQNSFRNFFYEVEHIGLLVQKLSYWLILILITQLIIEINEKYSPGVFLDILMGKYVTPKTENRIVAFIDLNDSTSIAEKLGHTQYFRFIREFIYQISNALIEYGGRIYQYVGDEIVVSWTYSPKNIRRCMRSVIEARKNIQKVSLVFKRDFDCIPEFRVGIHVGEVTVGEIGVIKKDIAMSGDTMNTTARIRSACSELNKKFIVSKDFIEKSKLEDFQAESLGPVELKGKRKEIELFHLKI
ncbi:adenylate/guanylate cyclase domain-containing protein [Sediminibacterium soli]|uniref:adenylate/guanylate cyclase domain-containing protein n=1 Tax=Sediminibacterium soli TaxID=2698829 RepID=UPI00137B1BEC|nr:adenylate/guanylate cyclase domain-containing protein [Sediminibacterium soli]NCI45894.1 adenylate/guanylate cyclase domain-containing protein [Sediminibacterium soli]